MEQLTGHSARQMQRELDSLVYRNPEGEWETADRYLSGDVRAKLKTAEAAAALDPSYQRNIEALKAVQPADLLPGDISARLGSSWIPASDIRDFIAETARHSASAPSRVSHSGAIATWALDARQLREIQRQQHDDHGTPRASRLRPDRGCAQRPHAHRSTTRSTRTRASSTSRRRIAAREEQQQLKDRFSEWIWQDEDARAAAGPLLQRPLQQSAPAHL